jgi:hypothetical protein
MCCVCAGAGYLIWKFVFVVDAPGVGAKAEKGYQTCAPLISALADYKAKNGTYPQKLDELVPTFLPESAPVLVDGMTVDYGLTTASYQLKFHYAGPGMNTCKYAPESGWHCSGFY